MTLTGIDVPSALMLAAVARPVDVDGVELIAVAYHDGKRYAYRSRAQAQFCFDKLGWGEPAITWVRKGTNGQEPARQPPD